MAPAGHLLLWLDAHWFELIAAAISALDVWLATRRSMISWPITILASALYAEQFRESRLYSDMLLQGIFILFAIYGWWHWQQGVKTEGSVRVETPRLILLLRDLALGAAASVLLAYWMIAHTDASLPWLDASLAGASLVGTWWGARKYLANWWLWIVVDVIYVGEYFYKHLVLTGLLYAVFVLLAMLGLRDWRRALKVQRIAAESAGGRA
jgi:nicotinamide mononucleotide transporter